MIDRDKEDDYMDLVMKLVNTGFAWSQSEKYKINDTNKQVINTFFRYLKTLTSKTNISEYDSFTEQSSMFNFLDLDNMLLDSMDGLLENKLIVKYGPYLDKPFKDYITEINETYKNGNVGNFISNLETPLTMNNVLPVESLLDEMVGHIKAILFKFYGIDERFYQDLKHGQTIERKPKCSTDSVVKKDFGDQSEDFEKAMEALVLIDSLKDKFKNGEDFDKFKTDYYIMLERLVYATFDYNTTLNLFPPNKATQIITIYQNVVDYVIFVEQKPLIELSVRFTIHYILDKNKNKIENLQNLTELYVSFNELFLMNGYREALDEYDMKRAPNMKELKELYIASMKNKTQFFIVDGVANQWKALFSGKRPPRYSWMLNWIIDYINSMSIKDILKFAVGMNKGEGFTNEEEEEEGFTNEEKEGSFDPMKESVRENFGNPFGGIIKVLGKLTKEITNFLKSLVKVVLIILGFFTNPFKIIEIIVRMLIAFVMLIVKILSLIKIGQINIIEIILYFLVLLNGSLYHAVVYVIVMVLTSIMMAFDIVLTNGLFYKFCYWMFGATENSPSAWYKHAGYHYGYDTCKRNNDTSCDGYYQNKNKRMFMAYQRCGDNYKPDRQSKGFMCERKYEQEPGFCFQSNIYRVINKLSAKTPFVPGMFIPTMEFLESTEKQRKKIQNKFANMKNTFFNNCDSTMREYDPLTKNICRVYPGMMNSNTKTIESLCFNAYCKNGRREPFCYKMTNNHGSTSGGSNSEILRRMFTMTTYFVILAFLINTFLQTDLSLP
jgi:hypothetical protein